MPATAQELPPVTLSEHEGVRYLHLGSIWIQGGMRIKQPQVVEIDYVQRMLASLLWLPTHSLGQGHAVQLGLGAGAITRFTAQQLKMTTTAVEINPQVVQANRIFFALPENAEVVLGDAAEWLVYARKLAREQAREQARENSNLRAQPPGVRLLHVDLYDHEAAAPVLDSVDFYQACHAVLESGGLMSVNLFGRHASFHDSMQRIAAAFGADQVWSLRPTREGNTVVVAGRGVVVPGREELKLRAAALEARFLKLKLRAREWLRMVRPYVAPGSSQLVK